MNLLLDIIIVVIIALATLIGWKRGFVKSILHFFSTIAGFIIAILFSEKLGAFLSEKFIYGIVRDGVSKSLLEILPSSADASTVTDMINSNHPGLMDMMSKYGVTADEVTGEIASGGTESVNDRLSDFFAGGISITISNIIAFVLLLIAATIFFKLLIVLSDVIFKLPVLHQSNKLLGIVFGAAVGLFFALIFAYVIDLLTPYFQTLDSPLLSSIDPDRTALLRLFVKYNPLMKIFG